MGENVTRKNVIAFSGGRTSGMMLRTLLDQHGDELRNGWEVLFCNTGKEDDRTLDFVHEVETRWSVPIRWLEYARVPAIAVDPMLYPHSRSQKTIRDQQAAGETTHWFRVVNYETAVRNNPANRTTGPFNELLGWMNVLPNQRSRACSVQMKIRTMMRYLFSIGCREWADHIGIRMDEEHRATDIRRNAPKFTTPTFPLIDASVYVEDVIAFWAAQEFDLQLPIGTDGQSWEGNCDDCFLKSTAKRMRLAREKPENAAWWEYWEDVFAHKADGDGRYFRKGQSYTSIRIRQQVERTLFGLHETDEVSCGCTGGTFNYCSADQAAD